MKRQLLIWVLAFIAARMWWRVWLYDGWPGSPGLLRLFVSVDGEASYDLEYLEMFLVVGLGLTLISVAWSFNRKARKSGGQS